MCYNRGILINCNYEMNGNVAVYIGFEVTSSTNPTLNQNFNSGNPPKDFRDASAYCAENSDGYCDMSSSVDNFVSDSDEFGWYTDEFGAEWFEYSDNLPDLEQAAGEKKEAGMNVLIAYFKDTLPIGDAAARLLAESNYNEFGEQLVPIVRGRQSSAAKN